LIPKKELLKMKKLILTLTVAAMLTGCGNIKDEKAQDKTEPEATAVTTVADTVTTSAKTTTAVKTTAAKTTAAKTTAAKTTAAKSTTTKAVTTAAKPSETQAPTAEPVTAAPKHYTSFGDEISEAEWNGLMKVKEKYGVDFEVMAANLCWESWPETIIEEDGTEFTSKRDSSEPLRVCCVLKCSDGTEFQAYVNEKTDVVAADTFLSEKYKKQFMDEAGELFRRLVPGCKTQLHLYDGVSLPFEYPADMTYEEFRQAFADEGGSMAALLYVTDDVENIEELEKYSLRLHRRKRGDLGYYCRIRVEKISQEDYDALDDVFIDYPTFLKDSKLLV